MSQTWYAAYTKFHHEKSAANLLTEKGLEVLLPLYRTVHRWKDRNQSLILPLFPCYLFVHIELAQKLEVLRTAGVRWLIEQAGRACPVLDEEIEMVRKVCVARSDARPHPFLRQGDLVRIRTGVLSGIEGILVRTKNQYRVVISVNLLQKSISVEIDLSNVEVLNSFGGTPRVPPVLSLQTA